MGRKGNGPAHRIAHVQILQAVERRQPEQRHDKYDAETAGTDEADDHGHKAEIHSSKGAHHGIHDAAEEVGARHDEQPLLSVAEYLRIRRIEGQQGAAEEIGQAAQEKSHGNHAAQTVQKDLVDAGVASGTDVLTGEGQVRLIHRIHGHVDEALQVLARGGARHGRGAEGIDGALDHHVGQTEYGALQSRGQSHPEDGGQLLPVDAQRAKIQPQLSLVPYQHQQHQNGGDRLGNAGGDADTGHADAHAQHKEKVQNDIDDAGRHLKVQRPLRVSHCPQNGRREVINHQGRHAEEINPKVGDGIIDHVLRGAHQLQHRLRQGDADDQQQNAGQYGRENGRPYGVRQILLPVTRKKAGHADIDAHRQTHKEIDDQIDQGCGGPHRRHRLGSHKAPHHDDIRRIEQQLQNAGRHQRQTEEDNLRQNGAAGHVHFIALTHASRFLRLLPVCCPAPPSPPARCCR